MRQRTALLACFMFTCSNAGMDATNPPDGSDPVASLDSQLKNGSRLHNKYINAADGSVALGSGLFDSQLNVDCSFATAEDGSLRCLPFGAYQQATYFLDSGCSQTFAYSSACSPVVKYMVDYAATSCGATNRVYNVTQITSPPANVYYKSGATCTSIANGYAIYRMYDIGAPVDASTFVAGMAAN